MDIFSLENKVAIVTGAAGLLGKKHCLALAEAGARVAACDLPQSLASGFNDITHANIHPVGIDVTDREGLIGVRTELLNRFGKFDILVNNAAINDMFESPELAAEQSQFEHYPLEMWNRSLNVNVTGVFLCAQVFGTPMAERGSGSIINVASTYGITAPDQGLYKNEQGEQTFYKSAAYPTTKGAVLAFTRFLAAYWGRKGVRVNALSPGGVENNQDDFFVSNYAERTPLGRMAQPTDYMGALVFLASDASSYMTGANVVVDGGWTIW